ncbi:MAG: sensor histidine kinase [Alphaproteobacteria bacterium]
MRAQLLDKFRYLRAPKGLRGRLLLTLAFAIGPVLAIVIFQAAHSYREAVARSQDELLVSALTAGQSARSTLEKGRTVLNTLQSLRAVRDGGEPCREALQEVNASIAETANLALLDPDGKAICAAQDIAPGFSARGEPWFERARRGRSFVVAPLTVLGPFASEPSIMLATPAVGVGAGQARGVLALSIRVRAIDRGGGSARGGSPEIALTDQTGQVLTGIFRGASGIQANLIRRAEERGYVGFVKFADGRQGNIAVAPLIGEDIFVVLSTPTPTLFAWTQIDIIGRLVLPVAMFALALATVWWAADRLVLRSVRDLRRLAGAYAQGDYAAAPQEPEQNAPEELQALRRALVDMAGRIDVRDATLKNALDEKQTLLREVHHRVKNNLQIMVSLFNMQLRTLGDDDGRKALEEARARVTALALVHQALYEGDDLRTVGLADFIDGLVRTLVDAAGGTSKGVDVNVQVSASPAPAAVAVPLALYIVEATTNALKHAFPNDVEGVIDIVVSEDATAGTMTVKIRDNGVGLPPTLPTGRTGSSLMAAFARQLGGVSSISPAAGGGAQVELVIPLQPVIDPDAPALAHEDAQAEQTVVAAAVEKV